MKLTVWLLLLGLLALGARCHNWPETVIADHIYFVDGDCYARMTRVRMIDEHPGTIIHHHSFENYPAGVRSHTTAPMDYAIVGLARVVRLFSSLLGPLQTQTLDLAGALISPLLGALTCMYLGWWAARGVQFAPGSPWPRIAWAVPLFYALCPIIVHAEVLGRPDHQSAVLLFLAVALTAELTLLQRWAASVELSDRAERGWLIVAGGAWAMALWVSLFEPLIFFVAMFLWLAIKAPRELFRRGRGWELGVIGALVVLMLLIEGSPIPQLSPEVKEYFPRWTKTVGELRGLNLLGGGLFRWVGLLSLAVPVLLPMAAKRLDRRAWLLLTLVGGTFVGSCFHLRWGYFLGLTFALALPWMLAPLRWRGVAWAVLGVSLLPLSMEWMEILPPQVKRPVPWVCFGITYFSWGGSWQEQLEREAAVLSVRQRERVLLRRVAAHIVAGELRPLAAPTFPGQALPMIRADERGAIPFLAPWWLSPALAYWTGQPGVTGSSHEGLPGIVDSARFYLAQDAATAAEILERRKIAYVLVDESDRLLQTSAPLLRQPIPKRSLAETLYMTPHAGPEFLVLTYANQYYKLFAVDVAKMNP